MNSVNLLGERKAICRNCGTVFGFDEGCHAHPDGGVLFLTSDPEAILIGFDLGSLFFRRFTRRMGGLIHKISWEEERNNPRVKALLNREYQIE